MPTLIQRTEVEATPQLVTKMLEAFREETKDMQFPYEPGTLLQLNPEFLAVAQAIDGMPAMVIVAPKGVPFGYVAIARPDGNIIPVFITESNVVGVYSAD